jgi:hypothetical protein
MKTINALKIGIQSIFERIGCNTDTSPELHGSSGVTESNMMHYLGVIEGRTNEVLQMYAACLSKGGFEEEKLENHSATLTYVKQTATMKKDAQNDPSKFPKDLPAKPSGEDDKIILDTPGIYDMEDEERKEDDDETKKLTTKEIKEKAARYAKTHFEEHTRGN